MVDGRGDVAQGLWRALVRAQALSLPVVHGSLRRAHGITLSEFAVLEALVERGEGRATMTDLQAAAYLSAAGTTRVVNALETRGLLARGRRAGDRRLMHVQLSPHGRRLAEEAVQTVDDAVRNLLGAVDEAEVVRATALLSAVGDAAEAAGRGRVLGGLTAR